MIGITWDEMCDTYKFKSESDIITFLENMTNLRGKFISEGVLYKIPFNTVELCYSFVF